MQQIRAGEEGFILLSRRETQVLALVASGLANKEIAWRLGLHLSTVKGHVSRMTAALGLANRVQLCAWGLTHPAVFRGEAVTARHSMPYLAPSPRPPAPSPSFPAR